MISNRGFIDYIFPNERIAGQADFVEDSLD
jgi:hypothetical protein